MRISSRMLGVTLLGVAAAMAVPAFAQQDAPVHELWSFGRPLAFSAKLLR